MDLPALPVGRVSAEIYTSPHSTRELDPAAAVIAAIAAARSDLLFAIYSLTHVGIADAIVAARQRGLQVRGVCDATQAQTATSQVLRLRDAGIDIRRWGSSWRLMHDKVFVADASQSRATVGLGSFNWTNQAEKSNIEVLLIARGVQVSRVLGPTLAAQIRAAYDGGGSLPG